MGMHFNSHARAVMHDVASTHGIVYPYVHGMFVHSYVHGMYLCLDTLHEVILQLCLPYIHGMFRRYEIHSSMVCFAATCGHVFVV